MKKEIIINLTNIKKIIRKYYGHKCNKINNMKKILEKRKLPKILQERLIT